MIDPTAHNIHLLEDGTVLANVHNEEDCRRKGMACAIHAPSNHVLSTAPRGWDQLSGIVLRQCRHGVYHPDFDALAYLLATSGEVLYEHRCCFRYCCGIPEHLYFSDSVIS